MSLPLQAANASKPSACLLWTVLPDICTNALACSASSTSSNAQHRRVQLMMIIRGSALRSVKKVTSFGSTYATR
eukprot:1523-Heterococcus_DN1.PRE.1